MSEIPAGRRMGRNLCWRSSEKREITCFQVISLFCIDRRMFLCYADTTIDVAMIIVATIIVALPVVDKEGGFS